LLIVAFTAADAAGEVEPKNVVIINMVIAA